MCSVSSPWTERATAATHHWRSISRRTGIWQWHTVPARPGRPMPRCAARCGVAQIPRLQEVLCVSQKTPCWPAARAHIGQPCHLGWGPDAVFPRAPPRFHRRGQQWTRATACALRRRARCPFPAYHTDGSAAPGGGGGRVCSNPADSPLRRRVSRRLYRQPRRGFVWARACVVARRARAHAPVRHESPPIARSDWLSRHAGGLLLLFFADSSDSSHRRLVTRPCSVGVERLHCPRDCSTRALGAPEGGPVGQ